MPTISFFTKGGTPSCAGAMTQLVGTIIITGGGVYGRARSFATASPLSTIAKHLKIFRISWTLRFRSTGSTLTPVMSEATLGLPHKKNKCEILELLRLSNTKEKFIMPGTSLKNSVKNIVRTLLLAWLKAALRLKRYLKEMQTPPTSGDAGLVEPVYDILNCGPRNRFCTPFAVAHNCLGLGYGCGPNKFQLVAKLLAGVELDSDTAAKTVSDFRESNPGIVALWRKLDQKIRVAGAREDDMCTYYLHSGRPLNYWQPKFRVPGKQQSPQLMAMFVRGDKSSYRKTYGGLLTENVIQGLCRDVLRDAWINLNKHGYLVLFSVHDELIVELPEDADVSEAERIMLDAPEWAKFIPLAVESQVGPHYMK